MIEVITYKELEEYFLKTEEHGLFCPIYEYETYDSKTETFKNVVILKTAQEVYDHWLSESEEPQVEVSDLEFLQQENKLLKAQIEALNESMDFHEELIAEMATMLYA